MANPNVKAERQALKEHVRARLRRELDEGGRGAQARLAKALGITAPHLSNMVATPPSRDPGDEVIDACAQHWGLSRDDLQAEALGLSPRPHRTSSELDPGLWGDLAAVVRFRWLEAGYDGAEIDAFLQDFRAKGSGGRPAQLTSDDLFALAKLTLRLKQAPRAQAPSPLDEAEAELARRRAKAKRGR